MKKNGFTLIEITAVALLLGIIAILVIPKVNNTIKMNKEKVCDSIKNSAEDAAKSYTYLHISEIDNTIATDGYAELTLYKLMQEGLINKKLENPYNNEPISTSNVVKVEKDGNEYIYTYMGVDCK